MRSKGSVPRTCELCGAAFTVKPNAVQKGRGRFCSRVCRYAAHLTPAAVLAKHVHRPSEPDPEGSACWEWQASLSPKGYGYARHPQTGKSIQAHRLAWEVASGAPVPAGLFVCHTCDNPRCVRNDEPGIYLAGGVERPRYGHLFLGAASDNTADMMRKQRGTQGERHHHAHLTTDQVRTIRWEAIFGDDYQTIAARYGVAANQVYRIVTRREWKHLD